MVTTTQKRFVTGALGLFLLGAGINMWHTEATRTITPTTVVGNLVDLHTVAHAKSNTQHFQIETATGSSTEDLHTDEPLMFMKAQEGEQVEATFTRETGYVSQLRIVAGPNAGFAYAAPDRRNIFGSMAVSVFGFLLFGTVGFGSLTDRQAGI